MYPKKTGKIEAKNEFEKIDFDTVDISTIFKAIREQKESEEWRREGGRFIPNPARWLKEERWEDEIGIDLEPLGDSPLMDSHSGQRKIDYVIPALTADE